LGVVAREEAQGSALEAPQNPSGNPPSEPGVGLQPLLDLVADGMAEVNRIILDKAVSDVQLIPELAHHLIDSGGKRLRPMLTIAAARLCGYEGGGHIKLAAAVEFMHTATLLHDDVVDDSDFRRGRKSARLLWGNQASVLVGDFLLGQAFRMMVDVGSLSALGILSNAAAVIAEGEVMQLAAAKNTATSEADYLAIITAKTAALFSAATEVGAAIADRPAAEQEALKSYGMDLGIAFQLVDDALDYAGESAKLGKATGDDFREGKITLPVILSVGAGSGAERAFWTRTLAEGRIEDGDFEQALGAMHRHGAIEATLARARHYGARAREALATLPAGPANRAMAEVVDFCISRAS
jgi:octaprenyl-diphosphate synthase